MNTRGNNFPVPELFLRVWTDENGNIYVGDQDGRRLGGILRQQINTNFRDIQSIEIVAVFRPPVDRPAE